MQPQGNGMAGSQFATWGKQLHTQAGGRGREGTEEREGAGRCKGVTLILKQQDPALPTHLYTLPPLVCSLAEGCIAGWATWDDRDSVCTDGWPEADKCKRLPTHSYQDQPNSLESKSFQIFSLGWENSLAPCSVTQKRSVSVSICWEDGVNSNRIAQVQ